MIDLVWDEHSIEIVPKTLAARRQETLVHRAADAAAPHYHALARLAFALGRRSVDRKALRDALLRLKQARNG